MLVKVYNTTRPSVVRVASDRIGGHGTSGSLKAGRLHKSKKTMLLLVS